jgi:hypothetical protein
MTLALAVAQHEVTARHSTVNPGKVISAHYRGHKAVRAAKLEQQFQTRAHPLRLGYIVYQCWE